MAERTEAGAGPNGAADSGADRLRQVAVELLDALREAGRSLAAEQKDRLAAQAAAAAETMRCAGIAFERADNRTFAGLAERFAERADRLALEIRIREWRDIAAEAEELARRRPEWFALGAAAAGFIAGRLLSLPAGRRATSPRRAPSGGNGLAASGNGAGMTRRDEC